MPLLDSNPVNRFRGGMPWAASERGSLLIVVMIVSAVIGISLASYLRLTTNSLRMADRSFFTTAAVNLAEIGVEEAMYCYNRLNDVAHDRDAWVVAGRAWTIANDNSVTTTLPEFSLGPGATGIVKVYCTHYNPGGTNPRIVARAAVTGSQGPIQEKWLEVTLRRRSLWANGMVARNTIVWNGGNSTADSWDSSLGPYGSAASPARANATVGTPTSDNGAVDVSGGAIRGRLMTAGGTIAKNSGAILSDTTTGTGWDSSLQTNDFSATFPPITVPAPPSANVTPVHSSATITFPATLPRPTDRPALDGVYYYEFASNYGLSGAGAASNVLQIDAPVVFLATNHTTTSPNLIDLSGNASISVSATGSLNIYTSGNIEVAGNGIANDTSTPANLQIFGTAASVGTQTIRFVGNGSSIAAIYAPNAAFQLKGNGDLQGAVVAYDINLNGNAAFHYDEALGSLSTGNPYGVVQWRELRSANERAAEYPTQLSF
jgi:hypothetical protein